MCVCCKLLEHIICHHVHKHIDDHDINTQLQHGFRSRHSCESQLITNIHDLMQHFDNKTQVDITVLCFFKAFYTVPHRRLLKKLSFIFELPTRLKRTVELDAGAEAVRRPRLSQLCARTHNDLPALSTSCFSSTLS